VPPPPLHSKKKLTFFIATTKKFQASRKTYWFAQELVLFISPFPLIYIRGVVVCPISIALSTQSQGQLNLLG
jgi:hypothetical protein